MLTLTILILLWGVISTYRVYKKSGSWEEWNPFNGGLLDFLGVILGLTMSLFTVIFICLNYLP